MARLRHASDHLNSHLDYLQRIGLENVARYEHDLLRYATQALETVPGLHLIGTSPSKARILSFVLDGYRVEERGGRLGPEPAGHRDARRLSLRTADHVMLRGGRDHTPVAGDV